LPFLADGTCASLWCFASGEPANFCLEERMLPSGRVVFGKMDEVVFGKPAAEAVAAQVERLGATS
jgi:hypothetical protein